MRILKGNIAGLFKNPKELNRDVLNGMNNLDYHVCFQISPSSLRSTCLTIIISVTFNSTFFYETMVVVN
jgi:hypothetical protein